MRSPYDKAFDRYKLEDAVKRLRLDLETSPEPDLQLVLDALSVRLKQEKEQRIKDRDYMRERRRAMRGKR